MLFDDQTNFMGASPSRHKREEDVLAAIHHYDDVPPSIRRLWSDRAPEFVAAAYTIRTTRPLAHYTSAPGRHASKAERYIRTAEEGTRASLIQSGFSDAWWSLCLMLWIMQYN